jgi:hypothetical protein
MDKRQGDDLDAVEKRTSCIARNEIGAVQPLAFAIPAELCQLLDVNSGSGNISVTCVLVMR